MQRAALDLVTTIREPLPLTMAFVAHHLQQGVRCLHLYIDDPDDPAIGLLSGLRQVRMTVCNHRYWQRHGGRPTMIVARQVTNAADARGHAQSPWVLHCDADEFLIQTRYVLRLLATIQDDTAVVRLPVWERCLSWDDPDPGLFGGLCRGPVLTPGAIYGDGAALLTRGMAAYAGCKSITRVSAGLAIGIHDSARRHSDPDARLPVRRRMLRLPQIVHFDGLTPAHAAAKMIDRGHEIPAERRSGIMTAPRSAQIATLSLPDTNASAYFRHLRTVTHAAMAALDAQDAIMEMPIDPASAAIRRWPRAAALFRPDAFDQVMVDQNAGRLRQPA
ncbi:glycosyltransferase family 2 protein [Loktanella sp. DJP18]|uniref:glycosyltransferase family 2 protein n=1 Tax=Loktanella sp. DJP18 TaxID=3409788 RepID=UPI003BB5DEA6